MAKNIYLHFTWFTDHFLTDFYIFQNSLGLVWSQ